MAQMKRRGLLVCLCRSDEFSFVKQPTDKSNAGRRSLRGPTIWHDDARMTCQVGEQGAVSFIRGSHKEVDGIHDLRHSLHDKRAHPVGLDVLDRRNEPGQPEDIWPGVLDLA